MNRSTLVSLLLISAAVPAAAIAQSAAPAPAAVTRAEVIAKLDADFANLDGDKNGKASRIEVEKRITQSATLELAALSRRRDDAFRKFDSNADGQISKAEFAAGAPLPKAPPADAAPVLARFDTNKDGTITNAEFRVPTLANFDQLDTNKDGTVTPAEQQAAPKSR